MQLWLGNFDFEHQLAVMRPESRRYQASPLLDRINAELSANLCLIAEPGDAIWFPWQIDPQYPDQLLEAGLRCPRFVSDFAELEECRADSELHVSPWGWSRAVELWCEQHGQNYPAGLAAAAYEVNSRKFAAHLEATAHVAPEWSRFVADLEELEAVVAGGTGPMQSWVVKAAYGMSARERIVFTEQPRPNELAWIRKQLKMGHGVLVEPWLDAIAEVSFQFDVRAPHDVELLGFTQLLTDARGGHLGNRVCVSESLPEMWASAVPQVKLAAVAAAGRGYRGPLGIDAMCIRDVETGEPHVRPIQDVNARFTMGRLTLNLSRFLSDDEWATWCHLRVPTPGALAEGWRDLRSRVPASTRIVRTSPACIDDCPVQMVTLALIDADYYALLHAESQAVAAFHSRPGALV